MRWIYLSPHLDDAVLSAGGLIYEQVRAGADVEVWTFMCGFPPDEELSPFAQVCHFEWQIPTAAEVVRARRAEDIAALKMFGAQPVHFDFLDCIYRRGKNGEWLYSTVFVPPHEDEADLPAHIADAINARLRPDDHLVCQFAVGAHLDHVLVRRAAELLQRPLFYDADIPYLFNFSGDLEPNTSGLTAAVHTISEPALTAWQDAILAYASQFSGLFTSADDMREKIARYAAEQGGIRLWTK